LAHQITGAGGEEGEASSIVIRLGLAIFFGMNVMVMSLPGYAPLIYGPDVVADDPLAQVLRVLAMLFAIPALLLLGWPIVRSFVVGGWFAGPTADGLVLLGATSAVILSVFRTLVGTGPVYFDTAVMVLLLVTLGRYLEARARADAGAAIRAGLTRTPTRATRCDGTDRVEVSVAELRVGDLVRVVAGQVFPTDGVIEEGRGSVDEALMTGEPRLIARAVGDRVAGGTHSVDGCYLVRVSRLAESSAAARIEALLESARRRPSPSERMAERFARVFLPLTVSIAALSGMWHALHSGADAGMMSALSVLVVACPCALGIATPVAMWFGMASAARRGVILRDASVLERSARVDKVYFDKTGTLTHRTPRLTVCEALPDCPWSADELLRRVASLEAGQHHPLARAVAATAGSGERFPVEDVAIEPGVGIRGRVAGAAMAVRSAEVVAAPNRRGESVAGEAAPAAIDQVLVSSGGVLVGRLKFAEDLRADAVSAVGVLTRGLGLDVGVLSGDRSLHGLSRLAGEVLNLESGLTPEDKLQRIAGMVAASHRRQGAVAFVGDGVNDAPALAAADVGIAFGDAADLPRKSADVLCVSDRLSSIPWLIRHSRRVVRIVRENLAIAFGYNLVAVGLAAGGWLDPLVAALAMLLSSIAVVSNARRIGSAGGSPGSLEASSAGAQASERAADCQSQGSWMPSSSSLR